MEISRVRASHVRGSPRHPLPPPVVTLPPFLQLLRSTLSSARDQVTAARPERLSRNTHPYSCVDILLDFSPRGGGGEGRTATLLRAKTVSLCTPHSSGTKNGAHDSSSYHQPTVSFAASIGRGMGGAHTFGFRMTSNSACTIYTGRTLPVVAGLFPTPTFLSSNGVHLPSAVDHSCLRLKKKSHSTETMKYITEVRFICALRTPTGATCTPIYNKGRDMHLPLKRKGNERRGRKNVRSR